MFKALPAFTLALFIVSNSFSQLSVPLQQLKTYLSKPETNVLNSSDAFFKNYDYKNKRINYLYPVYMLLMNEEKSKKVYTDAAYYDNASQLISFTGDYKTALELSVKGYDSLSLAARNSIPPYLDSLKNIQFADAKSFILSITTGQRVVMINEAHNKPLHRAFTASLLTEMYRQGFRYLAMEALGNFPGIPLRDISTEMGHYLSEPLGAELARKAIQLGYTLVPYEDTAARKHSPTQRDSVQASNIYAVIQKDPTAKILVHAGYGHIEENAFNTGYVPMAAAFKKKSGIDPFTIDQTDMTEGSAFEYGRVFYDAFMERHPLQIASIALQKNKPFKPIENDGFDISVIHPKTIFSNGRATWYSMYGQRKEVAIKPTEKNLFMVQAYYYDEYSYKKLGSLVPADQTYNYGDDGYYYIYLKPGRYKLVMRDMNYEELSTKDLDVQ